MTDEEKRDRAEGKRKGRWANLKSFYVRQFVSLIWMLVAVGAGLTLRERIPWLKENVDFPLMALLSGIFGIIIPNAAQFDKAGWVVTRSENRGFNLLVGIGIVVLFLLLFNAFITGSF